MVYESLPQAIAPQHFKPTHDPAWVVGQPEAIYGFNTRAEAIKWIRCEAVVWLWRRRELEKKEAAG